jgi:hypothetical protein
VATGNNGLGIDRDRFRQAFQIPAIVADVGPEATKRFFEFLFPISEQEYPDRLLPLGFLNKANSAAFQGSVASL